MILLNFLQNSDGSMAWDVISIIVLAFVAGWLLHQFTVKKKVDERHKKAIAEWEVKYKRVESEYKNYRANIAATDKHHEKAAIESAARVKALEGDIRVLAEEKNKIRQLVVEKEQEIKRLLQQSIEKEDVATNLKETRQKSDQEWAEKLKNANDSLTRAVAWEDRARQAEAEANKVKDSIAQAERKKLEAELRLKAVSDFAGKVGPLEAELAARDKIIAGLREQLRSVIPAAQEPLRSDL